MSAIQKMINVIGIKPMAPSTPYNIIQPKSYPNGKQFASFTIQFHRQSKAYHGAASIVESILGRNRINFELFSRQKQLVWLELVRRIDMERRKVIIYTQIELNVVHC